MATLSSVITQTVGNSSGGVNLITAPNSSSIWTPTGLTLSTTTLAAELPLEGFSASAVKFLLAGSTTSAYVDFLVPTSLAQTKLSLQWYARASVSTIGSITLALSSYASSANRTSNTSPTVVTLQTSSVASAATSFNTTFDTANQQFYRLTLNFPASASNWYTLAQFVLGPGQIVQGAAISGWISYTPTLTNITLGNGTVTGFYRRVGSVANIQVRVTFGSTTTISSTPSFSMPSGLTIDTSILPTTNTPVVGTGSLSDAGVITYPAIPVFNSGNVITIFGSDDAASGVVFLNLSATAPFTWATGDGINALVNVPIAEWAGNDTINLGAGAQVEYAWNSGTWDADDTTSFSYGTGGGTISGSLAANRAKRVRFQYPIQATDELTLEFSENRITWMPVGNSTGIGIVNITTQNILNYGAGLARVSGSTTDVDVNFSQHRYPTGATFGSAGAAWAATYYWRVKKVNPSSPVGFGLASTTASGLITRELTTTSFTMSESSKANLTGAGVFGAGTYVRQGNLVTCNIISITGYSVTSSANVRTFVIITPVGLPGTTAERANTIAGTCWVGNGSDLGLTGRISYASTDNIIVEFTSSSVLGTGLHAIYNLRFSYFTTA